MNRRSRLSGRHGVWSQWSGTLILLAALSSGASPPSFGETPRGLDPARSLDEFVIETWGVQQGLANTSVRTLVQDHDGYLWIGTAGGLFRFDGHRFAHFDRRTTPGFGSSRVNAMAITDEGDLWVGLHQGGAHRYRDGHWEHFTVDDGLDHEDISGLVVVEGRLHVLTDRSVRRWDGERFVGVSVAGGGCPEARVRAIGRGHGGALWWLAGGIVYRYQSATCTAITSVADEPVFRQAESLELGAMVLRQTADGRVWLATSGGLFEVDPSGARPSRLRLAGRAVISVFEDSLGTLWAGTVDGLVRFDEGEPSRLSVDDGLPDDRVFALLEDHGGTLWAGTYDGLARVREGSIRTLTASHGLRDAFVLAAADGGAEGGVWIGSETGVDHVRDGVVQPIPVVDRRDALVAGLDMRVRGLLVDSAGVLWVGTDRGLYRLVAGALRPWGPDAVRISVRTVFESRAGTLWIGTGRGLYSIDDERVDRTELDANIILVLHEDAAGRLWAGTHDGLYEITDDGVRRFPSDVDERGFYVRAIHEDDRGHLWLGTLGRGLQYFDGERFTEIGIAEGLWDDNVWHILDDLRGRYWMCSDLGIFSVSIAELRAWVEDPSEPIDTRVYGLGDGMKDLECNGGGSPSAFRDLEGRLWFPTAAGPAIVDPQPRRDHGLPFPVRIEALLVDDQEMALDSLESVRLPRSARSLEFRYTTPDLVDAASIAFRYRLDGDESQWRPVTRRRSAVYGRLPPGRYRFVVEASGADGLWSEAVRTPELVVPTPPWRSPWAYGLYGLLLVGVAGRFVVVQQRKLQRERAVVEQQMKVLQGLLPICAECKSIRDETGDWHPLEAYLDDHAEVVLSHGICPSCMSRQLRDLAAPGARRDHGQ
ncbi:MAG: two-component regulator propeller domain-containing protein [Acidobacteriota bacterium]